MMVPKEPANGRDAASPEEIDRQAAAVNHLLGQIGPSGNEQTAWWNLVAHRELGHRTATQAWFAGDTETVRELVEHWYEATRLAADRASSTPEFLIELRKRLAELDERFFTSFHRTA
ncbi:MAG: hypothetical protein ACYDEY_12760 [Acidimicrobiales bacterium]